jgi:HSP20 family protein
MRFGSLGLMDPWVDRLRREMDQVFDRYGADPLRSGGAPYPAVNVYETESEYVLTAEIPGVRSEDLEVSVEGSRVTLRGQRRIEYPREAGLHRRERQSGSFRRTLEMPEHAASEKAQAQYRNGVLVLRIPKAERARPRQIDVKVG